MKFSVKFVRGLKFSQECSSPPTFKKKGVWKFSGNSPQKVDVCVRKIRFWIKKFPDWVEQTFFLNNLFTANQQQITLFEECNISRRFKMTLNFAKMAVRVARQNVNIGYHFEFLGNYDLRSGVLYFRVLENITNGFIAKSSARQISLIHQYLLLPSSHKCRWDFRTGNDGTWGNQRGPQNGWVEPLTKRPLTRI